MLKNGSARAPVFLIPSCTSISHILRKLESDRWGKVFSYIDICDVTARQFKPKSAKCLEMYFKEIQSELQITNEKTRVMTSSTKQTSQIFSIFDFCCLNFQKPIF